MDRVVAKTVRIGYFKVAGAIAQFTLPCNSHGLANRPGEPYPATFRIQWTHRESNSDFRHARAVSSRWTMSPSSAVDRPGNRTPISSVQARHLPVGRAAHVLPEVRLGIE